MGAWVKVAVVVLGAALAACVAPSETTCGDGFVCGAGEVCRPTGGGCVDPATDARDDAVDGARRERAGQHE